VRVFENTVLRIIFISKREGVTGERRKLHKEEVNDFHKITYKYGKQIIRGGGDG
jgi:hypothetical protein